MRKSTRAATRLTSAGGSCDSWSEFQEKVEQLRRQFRDQPLTPLTARDYENKLKAAADELMCHVMQEDFNRLEPDDKKQAAPKVRYRGERYRINKRTKAEIATSFGPITLWSFLYLCEEPGEPGLHPLHVQLGIQAGSATAVVAERAARWAVDHSQQEVRRLLLAEHGLKWSNDRLRSVLREFRRGVVAFRTEAQVERLLLWLTQAERSRGRHRPVLSVGRDGVMIPMRGHGFQEASTATLSVYDRRRKRLGTVYLGQMPENYQQELTKELTTVIEEVLKRWRGSPPRLVYVTDKGCLQTDYYRRVLRPMRDPRAPAQRLEWEWVLDFFHVCGYVGKLREALFGREGHAWFRRMRCWLRSRRHGVSQILRSAMQHYNSCSQMSKAATEEFWKAYRFLRRNRRWMDYPRYQRHGLPIGSGVTEAACKTVFTQRLKRSGMRWHKDSGQVILDLRVLHLSGIWNEVVRKDLASRPMPETLSKAASQAEVVRKAA
jgi:hypothetical protein